MSTALQHAGDGAAIEHGLTPTTWGREQLDLIKRTVAEGVSDDEFQLFVEVCKATGLNPFQRQIYAITRQTWNPETRRREPRMTIQTGIDGYRLIAARTGLHAGTSDVEYGPLDRDGNPEWARVTVYRVVAGQRAEFTATARWVEYVQTDRGGKPSGLWGKMPHTMLGKCCEALALRKAFPAELSGVYTKEEMMQADSEPPKRRASFKGESLYASDVVEAEVVEAEPAQQQAEMSDEMMQDFEARAKRIRNTLIAAEPDRFPGLLAEARAEVEEWPEAPRSGGMGYVDQACAKRKALDKRVAEIASEVIEGIATGADPGDLVAWAAKEVERWPKVWQEAAARAVQAATKPIRPEAQPEARS